jgi:hypothetical protein
MNDIRSLNSLEDIAFAVSRINELEADLRKMALDLIAADGQSQEAYQAQLLAEAKLAKAVGLVDDMLEWGTWYGEALAEILQRLAELKGEKDE